MTYLIRFEPELGFRDIDLYLKKIKSHIRLEIGDKIALSFASFDRSLKDVRDNMGSMMKFLSEKSIYASKYSAYFEISNINYHHDAEFGFHGIITLKGK